jgi:putative endonuclease
VTSTAEFGCRAEDLAQEYLLGAGYAILQRNWREKGVELDLIVSKGKLVVAVEVKGRSSVNPPISPEQYLSKRQFARLHAGLHRYLYGYSHPCDGRLDLIVVFPLPQPSASTTISRAHIPGVILCSPREGLMHFEGIA